MGRNGSVSMEEEIKRKVKCFDLELSMAMPHKYVIVPVHENFYLTHTEGSFNVIAARVLGLSFPDYLRLCRDEFGAELVGKGTLYPVAYFNKTKELREFVKILNARANLILFDREHPDFDAHLAELRERKPSITARILGEKK